MTTKPSIRVLGSIEVDGDTGPAALGSRQQVLLAVLAANAGSVVPADVLIESIWLDDADSGKLGALHTLASRLRRRLPDGSLVTRSPGYVLEVDEDTLDVARFELLIQSASNTTPEKALVMLDEAAVLWRGPSLGAAADRPAVHLRAIQLDELRTIVDEQRAEALLEIGRAPEAVAILETLIAEHPLREQPVALAMEAYARSGRQTDALRAYSSFRSELIEQTGLNPSADLRRVEDAVLNEEFASTSIGTHAMSSSTVGSGLRLRPNTIERRHGESIAYASAGSGPPLVFMPGWISSIDAFADGTDPRGSLLGRLAEDFTVTVFDRYGTGLSAATDVDLSLGGSVDEVLAILGALDEPATVFASSAAGPAALLAAAGNPSINHLVLLCTYASGPDLFTDAKNQAILLELVDKSWGLGSRILADMIVPGIDAATRASFARFQRRTATAEIAAGYLRQMYGADASGALPQIEQSCLVMHYRDDPAIPYAGSRQLALGIENTELVPLDGPYHTPPVDQTEAIATMIAQFVRPDLEDSE